MIRLVTFLGKRKGSRSNGNLEVARNYIWLQNVAQRHRCMLPRNKLKSINLLIFWYDMMRRKKF